MGGGVQGVTARLAWTASATVCSAASGSRNRSMGFWATPAARAWSSCEANTVWATPGSRCCRRCVPLSPVVHR